MQTARVRGAAIGAVVALMAIAAPARSAVAATESGAVNIAGCGGPAPVTVQPGASATTSFVVRNPAPYEQHVMIEIQGLTADDSGYKFGGPLPDGVHVDSDPGDFMVPAVGTRDVHVVITAEAATPPGGAYVGLIVRSVPDVANGLSPVIGEIGLPMLMTIGGASNDAGHIVSFAQPSNRSLAFDATFANTGNVHYLFGGSIQLLSGSVPLGSVPLDPRLILPGTTRTVHLDWPGAATFSNLKARLDLQWGAGNRHHESREIAVALAGPGAVKVPPGSVPSVAPGPPTTIALPAPSHPEHGRSFAGPHARRDGDITVERASRDTADMALLAVASALLGSLLPLLLLFGKRRRRGKDDTEVAGGDSVAGDAPPEAAARTDAMD